MSKSPFLKSQSGRLNGRAQRRSAGWWREHYQKWLRSGLSKRDYCVQHKINPSSFYNWVCRLQQDEPAGLDVQAAPAASPFIQVAVCDADPVQARSVSVGDVTVAFDSAASPADIARWVKSLRALAC